MELLYLLDTGRITETELWGIVAGIFVFWVLVVVLARR